MVIVTKAGVIEKIDNTELSGTLNCLSVAYNLMNNKYLAGDNLTLN